jgi:hypothetical protein
MHEDGSADNSAPQPSDFVANLQFGTSQQRRFHSHSRENATGTFRFPKPRAVFSCALLAAQTYSWVPELLFTSATTTVGLIRLPYRSIGMPGEKASCFYFDTATELFAALLHTAL